MNYVPIEKLFGIEKVKRQEIPHKIKKSEEERSGKSLA
jgi:hypothetical protein